MKKTPNVYLEIERKESRPKTLQINENVSQVKKNTEQNKLEIRSTKEKMKVRIMSIKKALQKKFFELPIEFVRLRP